MTKNVTLQKNNMFSGGRDYSVDILRCLSCFFVVAGHSSQFMICEEYGTMGLEAGSETWLLMTIMRATCVCATNMFLMISGIFFLTPERNVTAKKVWSKNILKMTVAYILWSVIYALFRLYYVYPESLTIKSFFDNFLNEEPHLWYVPMMIGIYVIVPLMRVFTQHAKHEHYRYLIGIFTAAIILYSVLVFMNSFPFKAFNYAGYISYITSRTPVGLLCQYPLYCIIGYYLYTYRPSAKMRRLIYFLGALGIAFLVYSNYVYYYACGGGEFRPIYDKFVIGSFTKDIAVFVLITTVFSNKNIEGVVKVIISKLSSATLFIYLCHWGILIVLFKTQFLLDTGWNLVVIAILYTITAYVLGFFFSLLFLQLIPWTRMRNVVLDAVWPNRTIWTGGRKKKLHSNISGGTNSCDSSCRCRDIL